MTAQFPIQKERLEKIASWRETYGAGHNVMLPVEETEALARFALAAHEQEPVAWKWRLTSLYDNEQIGPWRVCLAPLSPGNGAGCKTEAIPLYTHPAPVPAVPDEIVGWVREENGDSRDPLFLCGSVSPYEGKAYNSQYYPVKRAAMLNGGKS